jgi:hypothetical protein
MLSPDILQLALTSILFSLGPRIISWLELQDFRKTRRRTGCEGLDLQVFTFAST